MITRYARICFIPFEGKKRGLPQRNLILSRLFAVNIVFLSSYKISAPPNMQVRVEILSI